MIATHHPPTESSATPRIATLVEHAAHLLPSQGPITVFVHHNTLHAFEEYSFRDGLREGARTFGAEVYLPESRYRERLAQGRIRVEDLEAALLTELGDQADELIGTTGTRFHLRLAMLQHPLLTGTDEELRWLVDETDALDRFRPETEPRMRERSIVQTRQWAARELSNGEADGRLRETADDLLRRDGIAVARWDDAQWESFALRLLWRVCHQGVHGVHAAADRVPAPVRHRDVLLHATGRDVDALVNPLLIRFCAAFLDQGYAPWTLPHRESGFCASFAALYGDGRAAEHWMRGLGEELRRIEGAGIDAERSIEESLSLLGVPWGEREEYLTRTLLALGGWAGMIWQMETNAEWTVRPAPRGTLLGYAAVRLILERLALRSVLEETGEPTDLAAMRANLSRRVPHRPRVSVEARTHALFGLAQVRGWTPLELHGLQKSGWARLVGEIESFSAMERCRIYQLAFERRYRMAALDALVAHAGRPERSARREGRGRPSFQVLCCIDDREESFRRHVEEVAPDCETEGAAGFFGVAMYYRGAAAAHYAPLCPVVIKPKHWVTEEVPYSFEESDRRRKRTRKVLGTAAHRFHLESRSFAGGVAAALTGSLATVPLVLRTLFPGTTARLHRQWRRIVEPTVTQLRLERVAPEPGPAEAQQGYSLDEMAGIVARLLTDTGIGERLAPIVMVLGHGSSSLNNPHESAYNCGACSGARGGPNARALAQMANDPRVRALLAARGLSIAPDVHFVGGFHDTCNDGTTWFDLERLPPFQREAFHRARLQVDRARERNAHERCRRFESAPASLTPEQALRHVEARSQDLSQARPEYNHATCALCIVGRRSTTRGLFLDRRAFLASYDPTRDDERASALERIVQAVIPVCAGISLEYYFSAVDLRRFGCGSKLPHNIVSLLGVMEGAASDLRTGLSAQMVEIHEPIRILFVLESTPEKVRGILDRNPGLDRLVRNEWVQLAVLAPDGRTAHLHEAGGFRPHVPESGALPVVPSSAAWYAGHREHLGFACVADGARPTPATASPTTSAEEVPQ